MYKLLKSLKVHVTILFEEIWPINKLKVRCALFLATTVSALASVKHSNFERIVKGRYIPRRRRSSQMNYFDVTQQQSLLTQHWIKLVRVEPARDLKGQWKIAHITVWEGIQLGRSASMVIGVHNRIVSQRRDFGHESQYGTCWPSNNRFGFAPMVRTGPLQIPSMTLYGRVSALTVSVHHVDSM